MTKSFFFYGVVDGDLAEDPWQALFEHFEKLASEDNDGNTEVVTNRKAKRNVEHDGL